MKNKIIYCVIYVGCGVMWNIQAELSHNVPLPSPQGIVIVNVNDNSRSSDALLHFLKEVLWQKNNLNTIPTVSYAQSIETPENRLIERGRSFNLAQLGIGASCLTAVLTWLKIRFLTSKSFRNSYWSSWRADIPLQVLIELPDNEIVTELLPALRAYYDPGAMNEINTFTLVQTFLVDISQEQTLLRDLLWWYNALRMVGLYRFLGDEDIEYKLEKRYQRLELLKHCIGEWANTCLCQDNISQGGTNNNNAQ